MAHRSGTSMLDRAGRRTSRRRVIKSSGDPALDQSVLLATQQSSSPFPPMRRMGRYIEGVGKKASDRWPAVHELRSHLSGKLGKPFRRRFNKTLIKFRFQLTACYDTLRNRF